MTDFLIKSTLSLVLLLGVYHLLLEKEKMHRFNSFYLLFALVFSMVIPFITIEVVQEIAQPTVTPGNIQILPATAVVLEETNYIAIALWGLYGLVTLVLAFRFMRNVVQISKKMKSNTSIAYQNAQLVLVPEKTLPHTFLNTIFINETEYNNRQIEAELYTHELTHVTQKHTLDILFIEILKTIFWFNPIFIFYKKAIQLNHEFLADEKVVHSYNNVPFYQSLLLSKANANPTFYLASNLNYILTKKRLLMMTKTTSKRKALLKKAMLLPLFTLVAVISCKKEQRDKGIDTKKNITEIAAIGTAANLTEPQFPGGLKNFYKFISANFKTDGNFKKEEIMASFIIESDGSISQIKIKNRILDKTKEEAIRVLKLSPKWNPARVDEKPVRYQFVLPITIEGKT